MFSRFSLRALACLHPCHWCVTLVLHLHTGAPDRAHPHPPPLPPSPASLIPHPLRICAVFRDKNPKKNETQSDLFGCRFNHCKEQMNPNGKFACTASVRARLGVRVRRPACICARSLVFCFTVWLRLRCLRYRRFKSLCGADYSIGAHFCADTTNYLQYTCANTSCSLSCVLGSPDCSSSMCAKK